MNGKNRNYYSFQGSLLIGVVIIMLMISAISLAIVERTKNGLLLSMDSKEGYISYQRSDTGLERFLNSVREIDNSEENEIPENILARDRCWDVECYKLDQETPITTEDTATLNQIYKVESKGQYRDKQRELRAALPDRIPNYLNYGNFKVGNCGEGDLIAGCDLPNTSLKSFNSCDVALDWERDVETIMSREREVLGYEVRRSTDKNLNNTDYGWVKMKGDILSSDISDNIENVEGVLVYNNDDSANDIDDQYGQTYYYTVKLRNKRTLELDSLYLVEDFSSENLVAGDRQKVTLPDDYGEDNCNDPRERAISRIRNSQDGCYGGSDIPPGVQEAQFPNSCCNGTRCYEAKPEWEESGDEKCALQQCQASDVTLSENPTGPNYCGESQECVDGQTCDEPYKTLSYCKSCPSGYPNWVENKIENVYTGAFPANLQPTCCYEKCKTPEEVKADFPCGSIVGGSFTNNSYCTTQECGPKTDHKVCNISCNSGFYPEKVTDGYPGGSCCYQNCPSYSCNKACSSGSCYSVCGGYVDTRSCFDMSACGPDPVCECGMIGSCTSSCSGVTDTRSCSPCPPPEETPPAGPPPGT